MIRTMVITTILGYSLFASGDKILSEKDLVNIDSVEEYVEFKNGTLDKDLSKNISTPIEDKNIKSTILEEVAISTSNELTAEDLEINLDGCKSCHGYEFNKQALGKSVDITGMTLDELKNSMKGYKNGTYGGPMKAIMSMHVKKYTDEEIDAIAQTIWNLNNK